MKDRRKLLKIVLIVVAVTAVLALLIYGGTLLERMAEKPVNPNPDPSATRPTYSNEEWETVYHNGQAYRYNDDLSVLLIIGVDDEEMEEGFAYRNNGQSDFLVLAIFDTSVNRYTMLQLNRDTMAEVPEPGALGTMTYRYEQLALAHTYGGGGRDSCENTVLAVSNFLYEIPIDNYFAVTMDAIPTLNDLVGGVTVTIEDDFSGVDDTLVKGETVTLMGQHAVNFVRARSSMREDDTNLARMRRQRTYMASLADSMKAAMNKDRGVVLQAYDALGDSMVTDCLLDQLLTYADAFAGYVSDGIVTPEGEAKVGEEFMEFYVDEDALRQQVIDLFYLPVEE